MAEVFAQILVSLKLDELSVNGTQLDLLGLSSEIKRHLENLPMTGPQMRVASVEPITKAWEIEAQLKIDRPFPLVGSI